jgi:dCTP deaminase
MPVLSRVDLRRLVEAGEIQFDPPLEENQWGEASVDLRLGFSFTQLRGGAGMKLSVADGLAVLGRSGLWRTMKLSETDAHGHRETYDLGPGEFVLAMTHESITVPRNLIAMVEGRSTYARVGLTMHQTAPWIQPGWRGPIILEIRNQGPLTIELTPLVDRPCQLVFLQLTTELPESMAYGSRDADRYKDQTHPLDHEHRPKRGPKKTGPVKPRPRAARNR